MRKNLTLVLFTFCSVLFHLKSKAQITQLQDYQNLSSASIGTFQGINFREAGFSTLFPIQGTNGKEFWTCSDRGVNVDCANANTASCRPTYDKLYAFPSYVPKIHRIRISGNSVQILQTITIKRPNGTGASGIINPTGLGSTATEVASTDTVQDCANFSLKTTPKDTFGIDPEGLVVDKNGNFWLCEEGGATIWKLNPNGVLIQRYTPYANLAGAQAVDTQIDSVFKYRKNNRGFEGIALAPNGKIYAIIQSPILYPTTAVGEASRIHRILEIDPTTNTQRMIVYLNDGIIGASGANQIRLRDWKIGDMAAINDSTFLVLEAAARGTSDIKRLYMININQATAVHSGLYGTNTLEGLVDSTGLAGYGIKAVKKTLVMDLLANSWPASLDKAEGLAIINDSTIAIANDNDFGQTSPAQDGVATATANVSHVITYGLSGANKLANYKAPVATTLSLGVTGDNSSQAPYVQALAAGVKLTSILSVPDSIAGGYKMAGIPDGLGAFDNGNGTFTLLMNHEIGNTLGAVRAHGSIGSFVSKWVINKSNLTVVSGSDLMQNVNLYDTATQTYVTYNSGNPSSKAAFGRFCSADLPPVSAFYNAATGKGTQERIFMNGEETNDESRAMAHIVTGVNGGTSWELPALGKGAWENAVACPNTGDKTAVVLMNDGTDGQVYVYIGTKTNTGTEVDKAGLTNGTPWGVKVTGFAAERTSTTSNIAIPTPGTRFSLVDMGNVKQMSGVAFNTASNVAGVTKFSRPEDGAWDPSNPRDFYFNTTDQIDQVTDGVGTQVGRSRVWRLRFDSLSNLALGGTIEAVLDGTEGQNMLDNMAIDKYGHILLQEDVGNSAHNGKIYQYTIATDQLKVLAKHDPARFGDIGLAATAPYNQDEETSGIIDMEDILGKGMFLTSDQAHYAISGAAVEGGQLLAMFNPDTYNSSIGTGLSSSQTPYVLPLATGVKLTSILSVPDSIAGGYRMAGIPDGLGAFDNGNGTFTLLMNHEIGNTLGAVRAHGSIGSFVSKWVINKSNLTVVSGSDLMQNVNLYDTATQTYVTYNSSNPSTKAAFGRFCSADLPPVSAFYNAATGKGTQERIFMNGEETNDESRAMAHIVTGANGGTSWELPALGKGAWENAVASPSTGDKTVVALMNDGTDGQVYFYIGNKTNTGTEVDKAGLTNGTPWGVKVTGFAAERTSTTSNIAIPTPGTRFSLVDMGNVKQMSGVAFNTASNTAGVTKFSRPEDGAWDPSNPRDFYFNTTDQIDQVTDGVGTQVGRSRLWRLRFDSLSNPALGGTIEAVLDGTEGQNMLDNMAIDKYGHILLQEDVGNSAHNGKIYQYTIATDQLKVLTKHDPARFGDIGLAATAPYNQDEETSGIIDMEDILGKGMFLTSDQAHYGITGAAVEGGQLLSMFNPDTYNAKPIISIAAARALTTTTDTVRVRGVVTRAWGRFIYIQDGTGAIGVRQASGAMVDSITSGGLKEGDSVEVFGGKGEFNNYAQLQLFNGAYTENSRVNKIASNVTVPAPVVLTLKQINTNGEQYESKVVRVVGLRTNSTSTTFAASSNTTVWDGPNTGDTTILRVIAAQDTEVEDAPAVPVYKGVFIFEGILAQFCSSPTNGCTSGYQLYGVRKKDIMESPLSAFSLLSPANNTRINTDSANTSAIQINWNSSVNATKYKWFLTSATGSFNTPLTVLNANNAGADTVLSLTSGALDAMLANLSVNKGDSIKTKWTVFAYKGLSDSLQATQVFNITLARNKAVLGAFNLSAPVNNTRLVVEEASTTAFNINWTKSTNAVTYKWFLTTAAGSFATPLARLNSNNAGTDSVLTITSGAIDNVLNSLSIKRTDSTVLKWTVYAYLTASDSLKASQDFTVNVIRNRVLGAFSLTAPANNARVEVQENNTTPVVITWSASAKATKYIWKAALLSGNFATPLLSRNADNAGADTKLTLTSGALDAILATNSVKRGDSITLKWTVYAYETTDSLKAVETFNVTLVRKRILGSFSLTAPANNARVEVEQNNTTPIVITWSASANASKYKWKAATLTGNFAAPLLNIDADNTGADTKLTLTSNAIDVILANNGIAKGDSLNLKWTVYAYETTDSLQATETFNVKLVRMKNVGIPTISSVENINVYPNPSNADATLAIQLQATEHTIVSLVDLQGKAVVNVLESDLTAGQHNVNLQTANLQNGVYFVRVTTGNKTTTIKLVVMH